MNKLIGVVALLVLTAQAFRVPVAQTGSQNQVVFQGGHALQTGNQVGRTYDQTPSFQNAFQAPPKILLTTWLLDWQDQTPSGYKVEVLDRSTRNFVIRYTALTPRQVYSIFVNWIATDDPRIHIDTVEREGEALGPLSSGANANREQVFPIQFRRGALPQAGSFTGASFITGVRMRQVNSLLFTQLLAPTQTSANLRVWTWAVTIIEYFRVDYIVGDAEALFTRQIEFRVPDGNHPWLRRGPSESVVPVAGDIPPAFRSGNRAFTWGLNGYDAEISRNMRVFARNFQIEGERVTGQLGTWWDSQTYHLSVYAAIYKPGDYKIFGDCAEVFSECNFGGRSLEICTNVQNFNERQFTGPVRSFYVPPGRTLRLYNQENLRGQVASFTESNTCVENLSFSLMQLH